MFSLKWCIICRCTCNHNEGNCFEVYRIARKEPINDVVNRFGRAGYEVLQCYSYMDNVLESLYKNKRCYYTQSWVVFYLLDFVARYMYLHDRPCSDDPFSTFEEICICLAVSKQIELLDPTIIESECIKICGKVLEKRDKRVCTEKHLPSPFVTDVTRTLTDAKALTCNYKRTRH
jgi:hypothetical protein